MSNNQPVTKEQFTKRLVNLCLRSGLVGFPRDEADQHILLKSAVLIIGGSDALSEREVNDKLQIWLTQVCQIRDFDRVTLRRRLVDAGYLTRSSDGARYQVMQSGPKPGYFDADVDDIDVMEAIHKAQEDKERRKREFLARGKGA